MSVTKFLFFCTAILSIQSTLPPWHRAFKKDRATTIATVSTSPEYRAPLGTDSNQNKCRNRARPIGAKIRDELEFVTAPLNQTITLKCFYCNEADDALTKIWYFRNRFTSNTTLTELKSDTFSNTTRNRIFVKFDHTLVIKNVLASDAGLYECHGRRGEDTENKFNYMVDVIFPTIPIIVGNLDGWKNYSIEVYQKINAYFAQNPPPELQILHKIRTQLRVISEWSPWSNCDGCLKLRRRTAECRIKPEIAENEFSGVKSKRQNLDYYTTQETVDRTNRLTTETETSPDFKPYEPPTVKIQLYSTIRQIETLEDLIPSTATDIHLLILRSYEVSCHSLALASTFPEISRNVSKLSNYVITESCYSPCKQSSRSATQPKYKNRITLEEGDHITLVCPEASLESKVIWRRNGVSIKVHSYEIDTEDDIFVDTYSNLHITYARKEKSGNYTCFINDEKIQEIIVDVNVKSAIQNAAFLRHMQYLSFMVLFGVIFYVAGVILAWTQRYSFKQIDFSLEDEKRTNPTLLDSLIESGDD